jgi:ankyrin repeat protein
MAVNEEGFTALYYALKFAAEEGPSSSSLPPTLGAHVAAMEWLLQYGVDVHPKGVSLLHYAACHDKCGSLMALLLQYGVDIDKVDRDGCTALHLVVHRSMMPRVPKIKLLVNYGANMVAEDHAGNKPLDLADGIARAWLEERMLQELLCQAIEANDIGAIVEAVEEGASIESTIAGLTALQFAAQLGHLEAMVWLVEHGAEVRAMNEEGFTALYYATAAASRAGGSRERPMKDRYLASMVWLLDHGAEVDAEDKQGVTLLHYTACLDRFGALMSVLLEYGADAIGLDISGSTAIHKAAWYGHSLSMKVLVEHGADALAKGNNGRIPLHLAASANRVLAMKFCLEQGSDINAHDALGATALHDAAKNGHLRATKLCLDNGADITATDSPGATALHDAAEKGHLRVMELLLGYGADVTARKHNGMKVLDSANDEARDWFLRQRESASDAAMASLLGEEAADDDAGSGAGNKKGKNKNKNKKKKKAQKGKPEEQPGEECGEQHQQRKAPAPAPAPVAARTNAPTMPWVPPEEMAAMVQGLQLMPFELQEKMGLPPAMLAMVQSTPAEELGHKLREAQQQLGERRKVQQQLGEQALRKLVRFDSFGPSNESGGALEEEGSSGANKNDIGDWNQFVANEKLFGVKSTYDEDMFVSAYTTHLDKNKLTWVQKEKARWFADAIMGSADNDNMHVKEEREEEKVEECGEGEGGKGGCSMKATNKAIRIVTPDSAMLSLPAEEDANAGAGACKKKRKKKKRSQKHGTNDADGGGGGEESNVMTSMERGISPRAAAENLSTELADFEQQWATLGWDRAGSDLCKSAEPEPISSAEFQRMEQLRQRLVQLKAENAKLVAKEAELRAEKMQAVPFSDHVSDSLNGATSEVQSLTARVHELEIRLEAERGAGGELDQDGVSPEYEELRAKFELLEQIYQPVHTENEQRRQLLVGARQAALDVGKSRLDLELPVKRMGELDSAKLNRLGVAVEGISLLQSTVCDPNFYPWRTRAVKQGSDEAETTPNWDDGKLKAVVHDYDDASNGSSGNRGRHVAMEVLRCSKELLQWNPSGGYCVTIPYHYGKGRELTPGEVLKLAVGIDVPRSRPQSNAAAEYAGGIGGAESRGTSGSFGIGTHGRGKISTGDRNSQYAGGRQQQAPRGSGMGGRGRVGWQRGGQGGTAGRAGGQRGRGRGRGGGGGGWGGSKGRGGLVSTGGRGGGKRGGWGGGGGGGKGRGGAGGTLRPPPGLG